MTTNRHTSPKHRKRQPAPRRRRSSSVILVVGALLLLLAFAWHQSVSQPTTPNLAYDQQLSQMIETDLKSDIETTRAQIAQLEDQQTKHNLKVVDDATVQQRLIAVKRNLPSHNIHAARARLKRLDAEVAVWQKQLDDQIQAQKIAQQKVQSASSVGAVPLRPLAPAGFYLQIPILLYHYTPVDFESQMRALIAKDYTTIDLDQLAAGLRSHAPLPAKPVVITFDDGFANQMGAFAILKKYNLKATYYIINGGEASKWCLGSNRHEGLPCGDAYLSWAQVRELDQSGLITIAAHTVDHSNLASLNPTQQAYEINQSKAELESQLGHPVNHFAYPYGSYNSTTINLVRQAGFSTAVSTLPGTLQSLSSLYTLHRSRSVSALP